MMGPAKFHSWEFEVRHGARLEFLTHYTAKGEDLRIIIGDENWVHYWTPSIKEASMMWKTAEEPTLLTFKEHPSAGKIIATGFWN